MNNSLLYIAETPESIALPRVSNLVDLGRHQMLSKSSTKPQHPVKPSRIQRRINVDRVSIRKVSLLTASALRLRKDGLRIAIHWCGTFTNTDSYSRCFRYLDCFDGYIGIAQSGRAFYGSVSNLGLPVREVIGSTPIAVIAFKAVSIPSNLDRQLKDNQGGCLYEWPCSQNTWRGVRAC